MHRDYTVMGGGCRERMERLIMKDTIGADPVVRTKTRHEEAFVKHVEEQYAREKKIARHSHNAQEPNQNQPSSSSSSSSGASRADSNVLHKQASNDSVNKQDVDMTKDDTGKQGLMEEKE